MKLTNEIATYTNSTVYGINHLIYIGYNVDWCILFAPGGIFYINRYGIMTSVIRQAVTAVESKESAKEGRSLEHSLWQIAVGFGFVYDLDDFTAALDSAPKRELS